MNRDAQNGLILEKDAYYNIFNNMQEIMVIFEIIRDDDHMPVDMIIRDVNNAYLLNFNISREKVINKRASQIYGHNFVDYYFKLVKENEEKWRSTIEQFLDGIIIINKKGIVIEWNEAASNITGISKEDATGKLIWDLQFQLAPEEEQTEEYYNKLKEFINPFLENKVDSWLNKPFEKTIQDTYGNNKIIQSTIFPIKSKKDIMVGSIVRDITSQKEIERKLKESRENLERKIYEQTKELKKANKSLIEQEGKFREIFNKANDMISLNEMIDRFPGNFIEINDIGVQRLGYSKEELLKMGPKDIVAPDKHSEMPKNAAELYSKGRATFQIVHLTKDGKRIPVEVNNHLIDYKGRKVCLAISRDISERKKSEKDQEKLIEDLKRSNEELRQYAHVISHDLQEPLRTIASFTQLLEMRYKGKFDKDADEFMEYIVDASIRMKKMIQDLLEYSKVTTDTKEFKLINIEEIIKDVLNDLKVNIENNRAEITYDTLPDVFGDSKQINRVFQNLISNAIKFRKPDEPPKIHITAKEDKQNNEYIFQITDNGIGLKKEYMERIFEIFQRLHTIDEYRGSGIGLSISKKIIERHGGRIWVESNPSKGSTFYFTLPLNLQKT